MKKTAVFGGKFDPPHLAHQIILFLLFAKYEMNEVWVIPSFSHPFGYETTDFTVRIDMCQYLIKPWSENVKVLDIEKNIGHNPVYTYDVLETLTKTGIDRDFYLVIGEDNYNQRNKWKDFDKIEQIAKLIVIGRGDNFDKFFPLPDISSRMIREMIQSGKSVDHLLPEGLYNYILEKKIY